MAIDIEAAFAKFEDDEYLQFARVDNPLSSRPDLCAFLLLDRLVPSVSGVDIVSGSEHDEFFLSTNLVALAAVATEADILTLVRCGVRLSEYDCLAMFS